MPTLQLRVNNWNSPIPVVDPGGAVIPIELPRLICSVGLPGLLIPRNGIIDVGSPLTIVPQDIWTGLREGTDFEWLPFAPGTVPPPATILGRTFTYRIARFLGPVDLMDPATLIARPNVIAQFASGNPASKPTQVAPLIVIGLSGGVLEGGRLHIDRDPTTGRLTGELAFP
jgi:hypothetical protein